MASRAKAKPAKKKAAKGKVRSKGTVATLPRQSKPGIGHNSGVAHAASDDVVRAEINKMNRAMANYDKAHEEAKSLKSIYTTARKSAKKKGINLDAYDTMRELERQDLGHVQINMADTARYMEIMDSPVAQLNLFSDMVLPAKPEEEPAAVRGLKAGEMGVDRRSNPFQSGTEEFVDWDNNWVKGQEKIAEKMGDTAGTA